MAKKLNAQQKQILATLEAAGGSLSYTTLRAKILNLTGKDVRRLGVYGASEFSANVFALEEQSKIILSMSSDLVSIFR